MYQAFKFKHFFKTVVKHDSYNSLQYTIYFYQGVQIHIISVAVTGDDRNGNYGGLHRIGVQNISQHFSYLTIQSEIPNQNAISDAFWFPLGQNFFHPSLPGLPPYHHINPGVPHIPTRRFKYKSRRWKKQKKLSSNIRETNVQFF